MKLATKDNSDATSLEAVARSGSLLRRIAVRVPTYLKDLRENPAWLPMFILARTMPGRRLHWLGAERARSFDSPGRTMFDGIDPEAVTHVLFTHLHPDHFWGALDDFDSPLFPNARWLAAAPEIDFWTGNRVYERLPADRHAFAAGAQRIAKRLGEKLERMAAASEWLPGIAAVETAGHTPGHVSFAFRSAGQELMVLGDALTHPRISFAHPEWRPASDHDAEQAVATRRSLLDRLHQEGVLAIGYHLPGAAGRVERDAAAYRFVPA